MCCQELVLQLHKVLEAAQLEKRTCAQFLAAEGEQERLELLRHGERRAAELRDHLESLQQENENYGGIWTRGTPISPNSRRVSSSWCTRIRPNRKWYWAGWEVSSLWEDQQWPQWAAVRGLKTANNREWEFESEKIKHFYIQIYCITIYFSLFT